MNGFKVYANYQGNSGVAAYKVEGGSIHVQFVRGRIYEYRLSDIGREHFFELVRLAESGSGLNSYINKNKDVSKRFSNVY